MLRYSSPLVTWSNVTCGVADWPVNTSGHIEQANRYSGNIWTQLQLIGVITVLNAFGDEPDALFTESVTIVSTVIRSVPAGDERSRRSAQPVPGGSC